MQEVHMSIQEQINELKRKKNAVILAHYYQIPEIQDLADYVGDSLALAKIGAQLEAEMIVVCGVRFMAETAKILAKDKKVLIPRMDAGCPMADMVTESDLARYKQEHPDTFVVSYVNTTAKVKALTDICVTSSNALTIVSRLKDKKLIFLPDKNLGGYIKKQLPSVEMDLWPGFCLTHNQLRKETILKMKEEYPKAIVLAHPECREEVLELADYIGSTKGMLDYASESAHEQMIIATEDGILHPLKRMNPEKEFILASPRLVCQNMKKIGQNDLLSCLSEEQEEIFLDEKTIMKARKPLDKMLEMS